LTELESTATDTPEYAGPWFDSPFFERLLDESGLQGAQRSQLERFAADGYLILGPTDLGLDRVDSLLERIEEQTTPLYEGASRLHDAWVVAAAVRELALAPGVIELLERIYRRDPIPFQTLNFRVGTEQATHSDTFHFHCLPKFFMCGVWVALEDIDDANGPLHVYPGSHRLPDYDLLDLGLAGGGNRDTGAAEQQYSRFVGEMLDASGLERRRLTLKRGEAVLWAANLYHGGDAIADSSRTRKSQVTHYYFNDCVYYSPMRSDRARGNLALQRVRDIQTGKPVPLRYNGGRVRPRFSDVARWYAPGVMQRLGIWKKDSRRF
jgi:hypothetical protein